MPTGAGLLLLAGWAPPLCLCAGTITGVTLENARDPSRPTALAKTLPEKLAAALAGREDTAAARDEAADLILDEYKTAGWPVTEVEVAPDGRGGLRALVSEGVHGDVSVSGGAAGTRRAVFREWAAKKGRPLTMDDALESLAWLHRNPLRAAVLEFAPGAEPASADAALTLQTDHPARLTGGWNNDGVEPLGRNRFSLGAELADPGGLPLWAQAEVYADGDFERYAAARGTVRLFLPGRNELRLGGLWTEGRADGVVPGFTSVSEISVWTGSVRWVKPVTALSRGGWRHDAGLGVDFFRAESGVELAGLRAEGLADAGHLAAEWESGFSGGAVTGGGLAEAAWSPGGWTGHADDASHAALRTGASAEYFLTRARLWARREWENGHALAARAGGQWASRPVLPLQEFSAAGAGAVRGFPDGTVLGDSGVWGGLEGQGVEWSLAGLTCRVIGFLEGGVAHDRVSGAEEGIASAGAGLRARWGRHALFSADYGWRLTEPGGRAHLAVRFEF